MKAKSKSKSKEKDSKKSTKSIKTKSKETEKSGGKKSSSPKKKGSSKAASKAVSKADSSKLAEGDVSKSEIQANEPGTTQEGFKLTTRQDNNNPNQYPYQQPINLKQTQTLYGNMGEKCEGCFESEAITFCKECNKLLCSLCDKQIHMIPALSNHIKVNVNEIIKLKKLCYHHNNVLEYYCESCNEPICYECQMVGPHNTKLHRISMINDSFKKKHSQLIQYKPSLLSKVTELTFANSNIDELIERIKYSKRLLERDIRSQYAQLSEKVKAVEGKRLAVLSYESSQLQNQANAIQDIVNYITDISASDSPDVLGFLLRYKQIMKQIEKIMDKPVKDGIDMSMLESFPNDLAERHRKVEEYDKLQKDIMKRDEAIFELINEKKEIERKKIITAQEKSKNDIAEWVKLSDRYAEELKKYSIVCAFCGKYLDGDTMNTKCDANVEFGLAFFFTKKPPTKTSVNSRHHYFSEPVDDLEDKMKVAQAFWKRQKEEREKEVREKMEKERIEKENEEKERILKEQKEEEEEERMKNEMNDNINEHNVMNVVIEGDDNMEKSVEKHKTSIMLESIQNPIIEEDRKDIE